MDTAVLRAPLPSVLQWIDDLLERHRPLARPIGSLPFERLRQYFSAQTLSRASVVEVDSVPNPPLSALGLHQFADFERIDPDGITFRNVYFVRRKRAADESLHFHELVHITQWQALGPERFLLAYALGHLRGGYEGNPLEQIAFALQERFAASAEPFAVEPLVVDHLERVLPELLSAG